MSCISPLSLKDTFGRLRNVSCGRCVGCRVQKRMTWQARLSLEAYTNRDFGNSFLTLTYNDANRPLNGSLSKKDLQKFLKRLRYYGKNNSLFSPDFKYFAVGEYGDNTLRCHMHLCCFGVNCNTLKKLSKEAWKKGFITCTPLTSGRIRYVVDYMTQFSPTTEAKVSYSELGLEPPFRLSSAGLGYTEMKRQLNYIKENNGFMLVSGKKTKVPKYFLDKLGVTNLVTDNSNLIEKLRQYKLPLSASHDLSVAQARSVQGTERLNSIPSIKLEENQSCNRDAIKYLIDNINF